MSLLPGAFGGQNPPPEIMPQEVLDIVARTVVPRPIINGGSKFTLFQNSPSSCVEWSGSKVFQVRELLRSSAGLGMNMIFAILIVRSQQRFLSTAKLANRREPRYFLSGLGELLRHNGNYYRETRSPEQKTDCWGIRAPRFSNRPTAGGDSKDTENQVRIPVADLVRGMWA